jgi:hypothetical protein
VYLRTLACNIFNVEEMQREESLRLPRTALKERQVEYIESTNKLLNLPENPVSAHMTKKQLTTAEYLDVCLASEDDLINLLSRDFKD